MRRILATLNVFWMALLLGWWTTVIAQSLVPEERSRADVQQQEAIKALERRVDRIEATHPEAMAEAVRTQQFLLWGVLLAVLTNVATTGLRLRVPGQKEE